MNVPDAFIIITVVICACIIAVRSFAARERLQELEYESVRRAERDQLESRDRRYTADLKDKRLRDGVKD